LKVSVLVLSISVCAIAGGGPTEAPDAIVQQYWAATRGQDQLLEGASMDVEIAAALPKLKKQGKLHALRRITSLGHIIYERPRFEGDNSVKSQVINRYLEAEAEATGGSGASLAVTPDNYNFKFKGRAQLNDRPVYEFDVAPKRKQQGLFKGQIWIDAATYLRVQESGYLVKSPSIFLKKIVFVRKYAIRNGIAVPLQEQSVVNTRLGVGRAELTVDYTNFVVGEQPDQPEQLNNY
jgi:hypothetical protein